MHETKQVHYQNCHDVFTNSFEGCYVPVFLSHMGSAQHMES